MLKKIMVYIIKPSKYGIDGFTDHYLFGYMPNVTIWHIRALTPGAITVDGERVEIETHCIDDMLSLSRDVFPVGEIGVSSEVQYLVALVGVQSHQFHRALDIAALAIERGALAVIGGGHTS